MSWSVLGDCYFRWRQTQFVWVPANTQEELLVIRLDWNGRDGLGLVWQSCFILGCDQLESLKPKSNHYSVSEYRRLQWQQNRYCVRKQAVINLGKRRNMGPQKPSPCLVLAAVLTDSRRILSAPKKKWILSPIITKDDEFNSYSSLRTHPQSLASLCLKPQNFENYFLSRMLFLHSYMGCRRWNYINDSEIESFHYLPFEFVAIQVQWKSSLHSNGDKPHEYLPLVCWEKTIQKAIKSTCTREFC